jgi:hypothetical protein
MKLRLEQARCAGRSLGSTVGNFGISDTSRTRQTVDRPPQSLGRQSCAVQQMAFRVNAYDGRIVCSCLKAVMAC